MSISKIATIIGVSIVTAGSSAAVATRDKWWPKGENEPAPKAQPEDNTVSGGTQAGKAQNGVSSGSTTTLGVSPQVVA